MSAEQALGRGVALRMKKVLSIAGVCCDMVFAGLPQIPPLGQEIYCREFVMKSGGGANCPISLARLGIPVTLLTQIGNDAMGRFVLEELEKARVRTVGNLLSDAIRTDVSFEHLVPFYRYVLWFRNTREALEEIGAKRLVRLAVEGDNQQAYRFRLEVLLGRQGVFGASAGSEGIGLRFLVRSGAL